jgi:hypothetical protein
VRMLVLVYLGLMAMLLCWHGALLRPRT